jgi:sulfite reductase (ferredoxin)
MRRLAAVGITTREACGNSVRNVTACPLAGICRDESFDVSPYARALTFYLLGHEAGQDMGRKFKIAFSGCSQHACGLAGFHDIGLIARVRAVDGRRQRGFEFYVGGGLGPVPQAAQLLDPFVTEAELLPLSEAVCRVFARLGERTNRSRARMKFLVKKLGIDEFRRLVFEQRSSLIPDPRWTEFLSGLREHDDAPLRPPSPPNTHPEGDAAFTAWRRTNVYPQRQAGYSAATIALPLGDFTPAQARAITDLMREYTGETLRTTAEQNLLLRWIRDEDLPAVHARLVSAGLGEAGASGVTDVTSCPGTDTCKLGISSSRGLAKELRRHLTTAPQAVPDAANQLHIKCSGCFNSCGQHHVADIGFLGVSRNVGGRRMPRGGRSADARVRRRQADRREFRFVGPADRTQEGEGARQ